MLMHLIVGMCFLPSLIYNILSNLSNIFAPDIYIQISEMQVFGEHIGNIVPPPVEYLYVGKQKLNLNRSYIVGLLTCQGYGSSNPPGPNGVAWINKFGKVFSAFSIRWSENHNDPDFYARMIAHEIGHTFNLSHNTSSNCVMKPGTLSDACFDAHEYEIIKSKIKYNLNIEPIHNYQYIFHQPELILNISEPLISLNACDESHIIT